MKGLLTRVLGFGKSTEAPLDYDESKRLLQSRDPADRRRVAASVGVRPEVLYFLATDPDATVRTAVAGNEATPLQADLILAGDNSESVRSDLARKISKFAPGLSNQETDRLRRMTYDVIETLIRDQAVRVRRIVADTLKDMPDAPPELVVRLARDAELAVSGPVLQYSPVLSDDDLKSILAQLPAPGVASAIARRDRLSPDLADTIGRADDIDAITALLSNQSAQIREDTLDQIIDRAPAYTVWHKPLVDRPRLSDESARKLALFVARDLISRLKGRTDLKPETIKELQQIVMQRLTSEAGEEPAVAAEAPSLSPSKLLSEAQRLKAAGKLDENLLVEALIGGRLPFVNAALSVLSEQPIAVVERIMTAHSAKGITALIWRAGLPMRFSTRLQTVVARIPASQTLKPRADGGYPLSTEALNWQLSFFQEMVEKRGS